MEVEIEGYQSIKERVRLKIEGLTVITGESNLGKSAICRAIKALLRGQTGEWFINNEKDEAVVTLKNNGHAVTWKKTRKSSSYLIDGQPFNKAGRSNPSTEIAKLGFYEVKVQAESFYPQLQTQFDKPFIVGESSPAAAAALLEASKDNQRLSKAIKLAQKSQNEKSTEIAVREEAVEQNKEKLKATEGYVAKIAAARLKASQSAAKVETLKARRDLLKSFQDRYDELIRRRDATAKCPQVSPPVPPMPGKATILRSLYERFIQLDYVLVSLKDIASKQCPRIPSETVLERLRTLKNLDRSYGIKLKIVTALEKVSNPVPPITGLKASLEVAVQRRDFKRKYDELESKEKETHCELQQTTQERKDVEREIEQTLLALGKCPLCKQDFSEGHQHTAE
jgi:DNA repair exonuclease SbcCD ATPase subunit